MTFYISLTLLQVRLKKIKAKLPPEYLYLNSFQLGFGKDRKFDIIAEINDGILDDLGDSETSNISQVVIASERIAKYCIFLAIGAFVCFFIFMLGDMIFHSLN